MAKPDKLAEARREFERLEAEVSEPARRLADARAKLHALEESAAATDRADRLLRLPALAEPATIEAFKANVDPLVARVVSQLAELRDTLVDVDNLVAQQEVVAVGAIAEATALGVPASVRVLGRGLVRGWVLDALRGFGACNTHLYVEFPSEQDRDQAIIQSVNAGDVPPVGMSPAEFARELLAGRSSGEIHSESRKHEADREKALRLAELKPVPFDLQKQASSWFGHRPTPDDQPPPLEAA